MLSANVNWRTLSTIPVLALAIVACGGSGAGGEIEFTDPERLSLLRLPSDWNLYEEPGSEAIAASPFLPQFSDIAFPAQSVVAFDGAPSAAVDNLATDLADAAYPIGAAAIRSVNEVARDNMSRNLLSQAVFNYAQLTDVQEVTKEDFSFGEGYEGVRRLVAYTAADGQGQGVAYLISVTNPEDSRMYSVVAGCSFECFTANQEEIERVVDSWLVNTKG